MLKPLKDVDCGQNAYEILAPSNIASLLSITNDGIILVTPPTQASAVGFHAVTVKVSLRDYPIVSTSVPVVINI